MFKKHFHNLLSDSIYTKPENVQLSLSVIYTYLWVGDVDVLLPRLRDH